MNNWKSHVLLAALISGSALAMGGATVPAAAQIGGIVHDPRNYAQNILTAARTLEQINNQIAMLQNQATSLMNEARNLQALPVSMLQDLQGQVERTRQLLGEAQRVAFDVGEIQQAFDSRYKGGAIAAPHAAMVANAEARWNDSVGAFQDAMKVQAGIVTNMGATRQQAGNQLLALQTQQLTDLAAVMAAQGRAQMLEAARRAAAEAEGRERFRRFRKAD